jgi:hypothetical protein
VVHNPPPGQYDPIFGGYNPGIVYQQPDGGYYGQGYAPASSSPTVIINQNFQQEPVHPVLHDYTNVPLPPPVGNGAPQAEINAPREAPQQPAGASDATIYLISMKDHTIYPALAYWMDKDTLNYVTMSGATNRVSLSLVDRDLSVRLNEERGLQFRIPGQ